MENYKPIQPVNIGVNKDSVNDFARKYNVEISNIYDILNRYNQRKLEFDTESRFWHEVSGKWQYTVPHNNNVVYAVYKKNGTSYQAVYPKITIDASNVTIEDTAKFDGYLLLINDDTDRGYGENVSETILRNLVQWIYGSSANTDDIISRGPMDGESANEILTTIQTLAAQVRNDAQSIKDDFALKVSALTDKVESNTLPIGTVIPFASNGTLPKGFLMCDGSAKSKTSYPELFAVIGTLYGGSGDSFNLPNLNSRFIQGDSTAGKIKAAEMRVPDHWHSFGFHDGDNRGYFLATSILTSYRMPSVAGKRMWNGSGGGGAFEDGTMSCNMITSYPSTSNAANPLVQPPAVTMKYIIKAFTVKD